VIGVVGAPVDLLAVDVERDVGEPGGGGGPAVVAAVVGVAEAIVVARGTARAGGGIASFTDYDALVKSDDDADDWLAKP